MRIKPIIPAFLLWVAGIAADPKPINFTEPLTERLTERYEIYGSFSQGKKLVGYDDPRYVASDKTDYLKSDAMTANLEFTVKVPYRVRSGVNDSALQEFFHGTEYLRFGGQLTGWSVLNGSSISIPKLGAPVNSAAAVSQTLPSVTRPGLGFFIGFGKKDFEIDVGINMSVNIECEGSRTRRVFDANGNAVLDASGNISTEQIPGRGCSPSTVFGLPTLKFKWGSKNSVQYFITAGREMFEFQKDFIQTYFRIPIFAFFKLDIGVGLFPNATLFLQPNFDIGPLTVGIRGGISLNYYESELRRVATSDALYFGVSLSGRF